MENAPGSTGREERHGPQFCDLGDDAWCLEVLLDVLAVAVHLPLRFVSLQHYERACAPDRPLGRSISTRFGNRGRFEAELASLTGDVAAGCRRLRTEPGWSELCKEIFTCGGLLVSNTGPFWTVLRGINSFARWDLLWALHQGLRGVTAEAAGPMHLALPRPFSEDFVVTGARYPNAAGWLIAGPVWSWKNGCCDEPGTAGTREATVARIEAAMAEEIQAHQDAVRRSDRSATETEPAGFFSVERLRRNVIDRPSILAGEVGRRLALVRDAMAHALRLETSRCPTAAEIASVALAALHLAHERSQGPQLAADGREIWHRIMGDNAADITKAVWLATRLEPGPNRAVAHSALRVGPPLPSSAGQSAPRIVHITPQTTDPLAIGFAALTADYAQARSLYIRERMTIIRLWLRDNFARWLTTSDLPETHAFSERVDALASRIAQIFVADRCGVFRYDAEQRTLNRLGRFARDQSDEPGQRDASFRRIQEVGRTETERALSPRYMCIDTAQPVHLVESRDDARRPAGARPGSRLVVPIMVFGRPWGVVELVGMRPRQFVPSTGIWLDEVSRLLGTDLYVEGLLNDLHEMSRAVLAPNDKPQQYHEVLRHLARIFVAGSAALHLRHPRRTAHFECAAFFGRRADRPDGRLSGFDIEDKVSKAAGLLRDSRTGWLAGTLGEPPLDGAWMQRAKTQGLVEAGFRHIALIPLRNPDDRMIGCITLASREGGPFEERFRPLAEFATRYAGIAIEAINARHQKGDQSRELMAHSLKNRVDRVAGAVDSLDKLLSGLFGDTADVGRLAALLRELEGAALRNNWKAAGFDRSGRDKLNALQRALEPRSQAGFNTVLSDIRKHAPDLRHLADLLSGGESDPDNPFTTREASWAGTPTALRDTLLSCVMPVARKQGADPVVPPPHELGSEVRVRISPLVMRDILNNFSDNAFKYRSPGTPVLIRFRWIRGRPAELEFRNLAPRLTTEELEQLGTPGFRGAHARVRSDDGQGRGLTTNMQLAKRWRMQVVHRQEEREGSQEVWHSFGIEIPADMIFEDPTEHLGEKGRRS